MWLDQIQALFLNLFYFKINLWGGSVSLGHPFGATGIRLISHAVNRCEIFGFFSSRSLKMREKYINFAHLVLLSLYIFWGKCVYFLSFKNWKVNALPSIYKLSKINIFFSHFEGKRGEKHKYFAPQQWLNLWPWPLLQTEVVILLYTMVQTIQVYWKILVKPRQAMVNN